MRHAQRRSAVHRRKPVGHQRGRQQDRHRGPPHARDVAGRDPGGILQPRAHAGSRHRRVVSHLHPGQRLRRPCPRGDGRRRRRIPARGPERPQHGLHLPALTRGQRCIGMDRSGGDRRRHLSLPGLRARRAPVSGHAQRRAERAGPLSQAARRVLAPRRAGHRPAGRVHGIRLFCVRPRLRRRRRAAPGVRHLRRHSRAARHPPGDRLPAVTGRRTDVAHLPRRAGLGSGSPVRHGRALPEHRPAPRTDPSAGHDRAGQHRAGPGRHAPRPLPLPPEPGR